MEDCDTCSMNRTGLYYTPKYSMCFTSSPHQITSGPHQDDSFRGKSPFSEMPWMIVNCWVIFDDVGVTYWVTYFQEIHISKLSCLVHVLLVPCRVPCTQMLFFCFVAISVLWPIRQKAQNPGVNSWCVGRRGHK